MSLEQCAERMARFLSRKPRSRKTRAYLETLPKRKKPAVVSAAEYLGGASIATAREESKAIVAKMLERIEVGVVEIPAEPSKARKSRLRPKARSQWSCRPNVVRHREGLRLFDYGPRDMLECRKHRLALWDAQEGICGLCGKVMDGPGERMSLDHVIPRFDGGMDGLGNYLLCHGECNGQKSNDVPTGCEMVALMAVNARLKIGPAKW
jgi:5-methylcytosine-specific restriction endonuclease McrA